MLKRTISRTTATSVLLGCLAVGAVAVLSTGCGETVEAPKWPAGATKWFERAKASYAIGDVQDAGFAVEQAMREVPNEPEVRLLAAQVALANLEFDRVAELLKGAKGNEARSTLARAYWYGGKVELAADALEKLLSDPEVRDPWATNILKLARSGAGRKPYEFSGALLAVDEIPHLPAPVFVVPLEVNGERAVAVVSTSTAEVVLDSSSGQTEPSWVSLRFGGKLEVRDVPALREDLSGLSKQLNAPIRAKIGVNVLRRLHATIDYLGHQFVVRSFDPPPPPQATTLPMYYLRGGGMMFRAPLGQAEGAPVASLLVDMGMTFPVALDAEGWKKAGVPEGALREFPQQRGMKEGLVPTIVLGAYALTDVPGVLGAPIDRLEKSLGVDLDGVIGAGLLERFRITFSKQGRSVWLEEAPQLLANDPGPQPPASEATDSGMKLQAPAVGAGAGSSPMRGAAPLPPSP